MLCFGDARLAHIRCVHEISRGQPKAVHFLAAWGLLLFCEVQKASVSLALQIWLCTQMSFEMGAAKHPPVHELMPGRLYPSDAADSLYNTHTSPTFQSEMEPKKCAAGRATGRLWPSWPSQVLHQDTACAAASGDPGSLQIRHLCQNL